MPKHGAKTKQGYEVNLIIFTIHTATAYVKSMLSTPAGGCFSLKSKTHSKLLKHKSSLDFKYVNPTIILICIRELHRLFGP